MLIFSKREKLGVTLAGMGLGTCGFLAMAISNMGDIGTQVAPFVGWAGLLVFAVGMFLLIWNVIKPDHKKKTR